jgi:phosphoribosylaminoimidazole-succinocarboxamide synthase
MERLELLYEGKAKQVYKTSDPDLLIQHFKDDATAFNAKKRGTIVDKGVLNNRMSEVLFRFLESEGGRDALREAPVRPRHAHSHLRDREDRGRRAEHHRGQPGQAPRAGRRARSSPSPSSSTSTRTTRSTTR